MAGCMPPRLLRKRTFHTILRRSAERCDGARRPLAFDQIIRSGCKDARKVVLGGPKIQEGHCICNIGRHLCKAFWCSSWLQALETYSGTALMSCSPMLRDICMSWAACKPLPSPTLTSMEALQPGRRSLMHPCTSTRKTGALSPSPTATFSLGQVFTQLLEIPLMQGYHYAHQTQQPAQWLSCTASRVR